MNTIYELLKRMITTGNYEKADMQNKLDVFFMVGRITQEQYLELMGLTNPKKPTPVEPQPEEKEETEEKEKTEE